MTLKKAHLIENLSDCTGMNKVQSKKTIDDLFEILKENLVNGEDVLISGFGKFCIRAKNERRGRNPVTGEDLILEPRKVVTFKCSRVLREKVKGNGSLKKR